MININWKIVGRIFFWLSDCKPNIAAPPIYALTRDRFRARIEQKNVVFYLIPSDRSVEVVFEYQRLSWRRHWIARFYNSIDCVTRRLIYICESGLKSNNDIFFYFCTLKLSYPVVLIAVCCQLIGRDFDIERIILYALFEFRNFLSYYLGIHIANILKTRQQQKSQLSWIDVDFRYTSISIKTNLSFVKIIHIAYFIY